MDWCWIKSTDNSNDSTEVVELLKDHHYLQYTRHDGNTLFKVLRFNDTLLQPERELYMHQINISVYWN